MHKFGSLPDGQKEETFEYPHVWARETTSEPDRLVIAPRTNQIDLLTQLAESMQPPFFLLYVLVVPRSEAEEGRYQSEEALSSAQLKEFLVSFRLFLEGDGRHNLWIHSLAQGSTLVYDRHNVIYAYGPLEMFAATLVRQGLAEQSDVRFPDPHAHHYIAEFDSEENRLLHYLPWKTSPLRTGDTNPGE